MKKVPFFPNLPDGTHCYQAALKMVLTYLTGREWSYAELNQISRKLPGKWTWPTASLIWLLQNGFEIRLIEEFSYKEFADKGKGYLAEKCGGEVANAQAQNSDLKREQKLAQEFLKIGGTMEYRIPNWEDLEKLFKEDYLIVCNINANTLYQQEGYSGHFVVPLEMNPHQIILHDPGLPPAPSLKVKKSIFVRAWGYPAEKEKNILAIRKIIF